MTRMAIDSLAVLAEVYEDAKPPALHVPASAFSGRGDAAYPSTHERVLVRDERGNTVEATVMRREYVLQPDLDTFRSRDDGGQLGLG